MVVARCPDCGAAVPIGAAWCGLCLSDLRTASEPAAEGAARDVDADVAEQDLPTQEPSATEQPEAASIEPTPHGSMAATRSGGRHAASQHPGVLNQDLTHQDGRNPGLTHQDVPHQDVAHEDIRPRALAADAPESASDDPAAALLAQLAVAERADRPPMPAILATTGGRVAVATGGAVALTAVLVMLFWLAGLVL